MSFEDVYSFIMDMPLPCGFLQYMWKDHRGVIQIGSQISVHKSSPKEELLQRVQETENRVGFLWWNFSPEGREFFRSNSKQITAAFTNFALNVRFEEA